MKRKPSPAVKEAAEFIRRAQAIKAKIGELLPAEKGGRGKKADKPLVEFSLPTIAAYRKIAANKETDSEAPPPLVLGSF